MLLHCNISGNHRGGSQQGFFADGGARGRWEHQRTLSSWMELSDIDDTTAEQKLPQHSARSQEHKTVGRQRYGGPGAGRQMGNILEVVSTLAQALTSARDQLVGLMSIQQSCGGNGGFSMRPPDRRHLPKAGARVPNIHRNHAHGHVAFGSHSEYRQQPNVSPPRYRPVTMASQRLCQHPLHFKQCVSPNKCPPKRRVQFGVHVDPNNAVHINSINNNNCRKGAPLSICFTPTAPVTSTRTYGPGPSPRGGYFTGCNPDSKRHCIGTQYAALLEEEAYHLRELRLVEECNVKRPAWNQT